MARKRFEKFPCSTARALEQVGDWWSLLIVRDLFHGPRSFTALTESLGVARNILTTRLERMMEDAIVEKACPRNENERWVYRLTDKGRDLLPVMVALMQWGDRWSCGEDEVPLTIVDARDGLAIQQVKLRSWDDRVLELKDVRSRAGVKEKVEAENL